MSYEICEGDDCFVVTKSYYYSKITQNYMQYTSFISIIIFIIILVISMIIYKGPVALFGNIEKWHIFHHILLWGSLAISGLSFIGGKILKNKRNEKGAWDI